MDVVETLRSPRGCSWDRAQTIRTMRACLLEEIYELIDAVGARRPKQIQEELGDVFFVLIFLAQIYREKNMFTLHEVLQKVNTKIRQRHPHVFSARALALRHTMKDKEAVVSYWVAAKAKRKKRKTLADRLPHSAPSLFLATLLAKELYHLGTKGNRKVLIQGLRADIRKIEASSAGSRYVINAVMKLVQLSVLRGLDIELLMRQEVMRLAGKTCYRKLGNVKNGRR